MGAGRHSSILELETIGSVTNHTRFGDRVAESYQVGVETRDNRTWWPRPKLFAKICCASMWKGSGAARGIRTPDPRITNAVLYRLSYCGVKFASLIPGAGRIGKQGDGMRLCSPPPASAASGGEGAGGGAAAGTEQM